MPYTNYPAGVTDADIDRHFGPGPDPDDGPDEDREYDEWRERRSWPIEEW